MNVKSWHFEIVFMKEDFGSRNDAFPLAANAKCN